MLVLSSDFYKNILPKKRMALLLLFLPIFGGLMNSGVRLSQCIPKTMVFSMLLSLTMAGSFLDLVEMEIV
jgi:hypothetical protein